MPGFLITLADGQEVAVEGTAYDVADDGRLEISLGSSTLRTWALADWVSVRPVGRTLSEEWPPANLAETVADVAWALSGLGHYVVGLASLEPFQRPEMNDLDAFVAEALTRLGLDPASSTSRRELEVVRDVVARNMAASP